jgi:hypothetical protein
MRCPRCSYYWKAKGQVRGGKLGGRAKVPKGFSDPAVLAKALFTRKNRITT